MRACYLSLLHMCFVFNEISLPNDVCACVFIRYFRYFITRTYGLSKNNTFFERSIDLFLSIQNLDSYVSFVDFESSLAFDVCMARKSIITHYVEDNRTIIRR